MRKILFPALLCLIFLSSVTTARAQSVPDYKVKWQATSLLSATFTSLSWTRKTIALGPYSWEVTAKNQNCTPRLDVENCYTQISHETWTASQPLVNCFVAFSQCTPLNSTYFGNAKWLWATGGCLNTNALFSCGWNGINAYAPNFQPLLLNDTNLHTSNNNNTRGNGQGVLWEPNPAGTLAFWTQGAYGYAHGSIDTNGTRSGIIVMGLMLPLNWNIDGYIN